MNLKRILQNKIPAPSNNTLWKHILASWIGTGKKIVCVFFEEAFKSVDYEFFDYTVLIIAVTVGNNLCSLAVFLCLFHTE